MSYLNGPRINFWGGGGTNVCTANNDGNCIVDLVNIEVIAGQTDDQLIADLRTPAKQKGQDYYTVGGWNYYGDHQVAFQGAKVSSSGAPGAVAANGELVGLPVYLLGSIDPTSGEGPLGGPVMVDLDPTSSQSTQIFVGGFQIGGADKPVLLARADTRCHAQFLGLRYDTQTAKPPFLTPGSVFANGTFQVAFLKSAISYDQTSTLLSSIVDAPNAIGIVVRFCMFEFMPGMPTPELQKNYAENRNDINPSLGRIIGTVGPWLKGEPATVPIGRLLQNTTLGGAQGLMYVDRAASRVTLDLSSALQAQAIRTDSKNNTAPIGPNVDYGDLQIKAGTQTVSTPSRPSDYYVFGGLYDVAVSADVVTALNAAPVTIGSTKNGLSLVEVPLRIYGDARNVYLDDENGFLHAQLSIGYLGGPLTAPTTVTLSTAPSGTLPDPHFLQYPATLTVPAGATTFAFGVRDNGGPAGFTALNLTAGGAPGYFINFRKYPPFNYSDVIQAQELTWDLVYNACLRYYYVLFPAMSKRIPLNDAGTIDAVGGEILKRLSPQYRKTTLCMPVTRSLPPGKIALLQAYLTRGAAAQTAPPADDAGAKAVRRVMANKL